MSTNSIKFHWRQQVIGKYFADIRKIESCDAPWTCWILKNPSYWSKSLGMKCKRRWMRPPLPLPAIPSIRNFLVTKKFYGNWNCYTRDCNVNSDANLSSRPMQNIYSKSFGPVYWLDKRNVQVLSFSKSYVVWQLVSQLVFTIFISNNQVAFHLWEKHLVRDPQVPKFYDHGC